MRRVSSTRKAGRVLVLPKTPPFHPGRRLRRGLNSGWWFLPMAGITTCIWVRRAPTPVASPSLVTNAVAFTRAESLGVGAQPPPDSGAAPSNGLASVYNLRRVEGVY